MHLGTAGIKQNINPSQSSTFALHLGCQFAQSTTSGSHRKNVQLTLLLKEPKHECAIFLIGGHFLFLAAEQLQSVRLFQPLFLFLYTGRRHTEKILNGDSKRPRCTPAVNKYGTIT